MSLGEQLQTAREQGGQTIEDIARVTFIRAHYLEAIERDDFSALPPSRLRYFIQDYAKAVGLDPAAMVALVPQQTSSAPPPVSAPSPETEPKPKKKKVFVQPLEDEEPAASVPTGIPEPKQRSSRKPRYAPIDQGNPALIRGLITAALVLLTGLAIYYFGGGFDEPETPTSASGGSSEGDTAAPGTEARILSRPDDTTTSDEVIAESGDSLVLEGRAKAQVWYSIKMDNRQETGTLDSGAVKVWKAEKEFSVSLGNAGGLEFYLGGKPLGALGALGATLRGKVITADGVKETSAPRRRSTPSRSQKSSNADNSENTNRLRQLENSEPRRAIEPE